MGAGKCSLGQKFINTQLSHFSFGGQFLDVSDNACLKHVLTSNFTSYPSCYFSIPKEKKSKNPNVLKLSVHHQQYSTHTKTILIIWQTNKCKQIFTLWMPQEALTFYREVT